MSELISFDEARMAAVEARSDELTRISEFFKDNPEYVSAMGLKRYIVVRRAEIVAMATRPTEEDES